METNTVDRKNRLDLTFVNDNKRTGKDFIININLTNT